MHSREKALVNMHEVDWFLDSSEGEQEHDMNRRTFLRGAAFTAGATVVAGSAAGGWRAHHAGLVVPDDTPFAPWDALASVAPYDVTALPAAAILASNPHNTQPWTLAVDETSFRLSADPGRHLGAFDPYRREMWIGLGAAIANAEAVAPGIGFRTGPPAVHSLGDEGAGTIELSLTRITPDPDPLARFIPERRTNRAPYDTAPVSHDAIARVSRLVGRVEGASFQMFDRDTARGAAFAQATLAATQAINADHEMSHDGHLWFRGTARKVAEHRDGVSIPTAGLSPAITFLGQLLPEADTRKSGEHWLASTEAQLAQTGGFGLIVVDDLHDRGQQIAAGRLWQRLHLALTAEGIAAHPLNQLPELVDRDRDLGQDRGWREALAAISEGGQQTTFAFRFGYPTRSVPHSARRPVAWVSKAENRQAQQA